ncbi:MAG: hypothetical protein LC790_00310, partial [Actinobacteria bacterium]|nr:hypothetical protein [Actinomycetota bacterium]
VDAAFERFTGLSIRKFMAVGMAFSFSFSAVHEGPVGRAWLDIDACDRRRAGECPLWLTTPKTRFASFRGAR